MATCDKMLSGLFAQKCGYRPKAGIGRKWYVNYDDVDRTGTQMTARRTHITDLLLKAGTKLYPAQGNNTSSASSALVVSDFGNGNTHTDTFTITYNGVNERERVQELIDGARVCTIIEKIGGGQNGELTYEMLGYESGMLITAYDWNSNENSGTATITVATKEGEEEATPPKLLLLDEGVAATRYFIEQNQYDYEDRG